MRRATHRWSSRKTDGRRMRMARTHAASTRTGGRSRRVEGILRREETRDVGKSVRKVRRRAFGQRQRLTSGHPPLTSSVTAASLTDGPVGTRRPRPHSFSLLRFRRTATGCRHTMLTARAAWPATARLLRLCLRVVVHQFDEAVGAVTPFAFAHASRCTGDKQQQPVQQSFADSHPQACPSQGKLATVFPGGVTANPTVPASRPPITQCVTAIRRSVARR